jgi:hypothetical protein
VTVKVTILPSDSTRAEAGDPAPGESEPDGELTKSERPWRVRLSDPSGPQLWGLVGVLGLAGALVAYKILNVDTGSAQRTKDYLDLAETKVHFGLLAGQVAFWFIFGPLLVVWRMRVAHIWSIKLRWQWAWTIGGALALAALIFVPLAVQAGGKSYAPIPDYGWRLGGVYALGLIMIMLPALFLLATIDAGARDDHPDPTDPAYITEYFELRMMLRRVLVVLGVAVSAIVITTGAYLNALHTFSDKHNNTLDVPPHESLIAYGSIFVVLLVAMFLPVYTHVRERGEEVVRAKANLKADLEGQALHEALALQTSLRGDLGLNEDLRQVFERSALVLSPLLSAVLSTFLGTK